MGISIGFRISDRIGKRPVHLTRVPHVNCLCFGFGARIGWGLTSPVRLSRPRSFPREVKDDNFARYVVNFKHAPPETKLAFLSTAELQASHIRIQIGQIAGLSVLQQTCGHQ